MKCNNTRKQKGEVGETNKNKTKRNKERQHNGERARENRKGKSGGG
jgi:hypothetical protein